MDSQDAEGLDAVKIALRQWHDHRGPTGMHQHDLDYVGPLPKAAVYARNACLQVELSLNEQVIACRRVAAERGWHVVEVFLELGPAPLNGCRPELDRMIDRARRREVDVIVASDPHHFASDARGDRTRLVDELAALGVKVAWVSDD
jgi:DNA invertase Pin-like site-specific DNA recombinase